MSIFEKYDAQKQRKKGPKSSKSCPNIPTVAPTPAPSTSLAPSCASSICRARDVKTAVQNVSGSLTLSESSPQGIALNWLVNIDTWDACDSITTISVSSFVCSLLSYFLCLSSSAF